jgi:hypothetical protein
LALALVIDASQLLNAVLVDVEVADDDFADVVAVVTNAPEQISFEVLEHLVVILP